MSAPSPTSGQFVVSARKYRPVTFDTVVGQGHITGTLKNAIRQGQLAQGFLFCGPRGVGKTTCARILAQVLNCTGRGDEPEPCGQCDNCHAFRYNSSFNVHELDAASNNSVEDIRSLVEQVRFPPPSGRYKIYIIDEVHMLSTAAFNAFLKTLEEPPSYALFILATTERHKILPTILSRCQIFDFNRISDQDIVGQLTRVAASEGIEAEPEALHVIARKAEGGMRDALSMFDLVATFSAERAVTYRGAVEHLNVLDQDYYFSLTDALLAGDHARVLTLLDEILRKGFDGHLLLTGLAEHLRNLMLARQAQTAALLEQPPRVIEALTTQAAQTGASFLLTALQLISQAEVQYRQTRHQRLHLEICLMRVAHIRDALSVARLAATPGIEAIAAGAGQTPSASPMSGAEKKKPDLTPPEAPETEPPRAELPTEPPAETVAAEPVASFEAAAAAPVPAPTAPAVPTRGSRMKSTRLSDLKAASQAPAGPGLSMLNDELEAIALPAPEATHSNEGEALPVAGPLDSQQRLEQVMQALAGLLSQQGKVVEASYLGSAQSRLEGEGRIILSAPPMAYQYLHGIRANLYRGLAKGLGREDLTLELEESASPMQDGQDLLYTDTDKLQYLLETYPALRGLRDTLGLEIQY